MRSSDKSKDTDQLASGQAASPSRPVDQAENGSMVQDMNDLKRLGEDMERMRTNAELEEDGFVPDPIQD